MKCIYCGSETQVTNSRHQKKPNQVWRRRLCKGCSGLFTTLEQADLLTSLLYKNSAGHVEPFRRDILFVSLYNSVRHRKTAASDATGLTATVISKLQTHIQSATIDRKNIIKVATEVLKRFDKAAAVTYQAFHP